MKRSLCIVLAICMLFSVSAVNVFANDSTRVEIRFSIGSNTLLINGQSVTVETPYVVGAGVTLVPLRVIAEAFGADVGWHGESNVVTINYQGSNMVLQIGSPVAMIGGEFYTMPAAPELFRASTMVPLRFISESLGAYVSYDATYDSVVVAKGNIPTASTLASPTPITLTAFYPGYDANTFDIYREAEKMTNVKLVTTVRESQDTKLAFNLMLLEEWIPDIIYSNKSWIDQAGINERIMVDLKPYVTDESIMPNLARILKANPEILAEMTTADGAVYTCPKLREPGATQGWFIRTDWLEKLGVEMPRSLEDFVYVMHAFRNSDVNANGKRDEIGYFGDYKHLFYFFGLNGGRYWDIDEYGQIYMPFVTEQYKLALVTIADWYKKGYIDPEIFTRLNPRGELWGTNNGGITFNWFSSTTSYNHVIKNIPGFHVAAMSPPENIYGQAYCHSPGDVVTTTGWGISLDNKHLIETLKYFDFWYSDAGSRLNNMGIEGRDYVIDVFGNPKFTERATNYSGGASAYIRDIGGMGIGNYVRQEWIIAGMPEEATGYSKHYNMDIPIAKRVPSYTFTVAEQDVIDRAWWTCQALIDEYAQKAILGHIDVYQTWDMYLVSLQSYGLENVVQVHNSAYNRFKWRVQY